MSWRSRDELFHRLESQAEDGSITIPDLLKEENFLNALGQQLPKLSIFVASHVKELIEVAIGLNQPAEGIDRKKYLMALVSHNSILTDSFCDDPTIVNFLANAIYGKIDYTSYFRILQYAIDSGDFLNKIENPSEFFNALVDQIKSWSVRTFLITLCSKRLQPIIDWLTKVEADTVLLNRLYGEEQTVAACLTLLNLFLTGAETNSLVKRISTLENYSLIFDTGIDAPTAEIADLSFRILIQIINLADDTRTDDKTNSTFECIMDKLDSTCGRICEYILRDEDFLGDKFNAIELIRTIVASHSTVEPCIFEVSSFLFEMFFKYPTNSFLHRSFLKLLKSLLQLDSGYKEFVESTKMMERLIYEHQNQTPVTTTFHGFIISMASELSEKASAGLLVAPDGWKEFIDKTVLPTMKRYTTNYGGRVPRTLLDTMGDGAHFIDEGAIGSSSKTSINTVDDDGFIDVNSDGYEEDEISPDLEISDSDDEAEKTKETKGEKTKENKEEEQGNKAEKEENKENKEENKENKEEEQENKEEKTEEIKEEEKQEENEKEEEKEVNKIEKNKEETEKKDD